MPDALALLQQQRADYETLLNATRDALSAPLDGPRVDAYLAVRDRCLDAIGRREPALTAALARAQGEPVAAAAQGYRQVLEAVVDAERLLLAAAKSRHTSLGDELRQLGEGYRALDGYRGARRDQARAISQRV